jgi:hypothetical protein
MRNFKEFNEKMGVKFPVERYVEWLMEELSSYLNILGATLLFLWDISYIRIENFCKMQDSDLLTKKTNIQSLYG